MTGDDPIRNPFRCPDGRQWLSVRDRCRRVRSFSMQECGAALVLDAACGIVLQSTVRAAIVRRIRQLRKSLEADDA